MFIHYYMTPSPVTIQAHMYIAEARDLLGHKHFRHLPVVDNDGRLQGMITDRDLRSADPSTVLNADERQRILDRVQKTRVKAIMSTDYLSLKTVSTLDDALLLFEKKPVGALPVLDSAGKVVGIFSLDDLTRAYRSLFGLGEKGSVLIAIENQTDSPSLSRLVQVLEEHNVLFTRLVCSDGKGKEPAMIYLRINTCNIPAVHRAVEKAGFIVHVPMSASQGQPPA